MPSPLERLQRGFTASAFGELDADFVAAVRGGGKLAPAAAVGVYREGYPARLSEALGETFEACWRALGDEDFLDACRTFARRVPSRSHNLSDYGEGFPEFLLERHGAHAPFIGDLGRLEWAYKNLFHAAPHAGLTPAALAGSADGGSVLVFGSARALLSFSHRVRGLWLRDRADDTPLTPADWSGPESVLLYKNGGSRVFSRALSGPEAAALSGLIAGRPLAEALAAAEGLDEAAATALFAFLSESGLVAEVRRCR